ncbi:hypothetical protein MPTK1_3g13430 [Marchantia polymorpha subsp. ruderalis]|uniref:Malectin-like domain-containing protein n=2 Tax=Marchantia polymorpha TaxID=3197 RepID=A0A176W6H4_MARPO|nr:hypothetical protein AXG93_4492s1010 [Marchantia polymorpha subsp. ruderalis]PTQ38695.1 hypothetical protein MARPO_0050s0135 [Marchantia polymorpha]BBN05482.1 hypothetical protein Mp_3g13430 [Marchantia polymorpha subsp. ruderalis]|eukprot:PTQ38695.1 hypothetical protein MARPO_0050s0135 [Marchantia polymorpha]
MARFSSLSLTQCSVGLVAILICLNLSTMANAADNSSSIINALTGNYADHELFLQCTCVYDTYRRTLAPKFFLRPGSNTTVAVDKCSGAKQVECDITRYSRAPFPAAKYYLKILVWYFKGPSQTQFKIDNTYLYYAVAPNFVWTISSLSWASLLEVEYYFTPSFLSSATESVALGMH